jgi:hypothetical protein
MNLPLFWALGRNFGDALSPILYQVITGREAEHSGISPKILAMGSILHAAGAGDIVYGTGCLQASLLPARVDGIQFRALRGPLTADALTRAGAHLSPSLLYGSPANLLPRYVPASQERTAEIGFLPHYIDYGQVKGLPQGVRLLWTAAEPLELVRQITACALVVSSSLHGLIVAEAYGIPAVWVELSDNVIGGGFKFRDYYAGTGRTIEPLDWRSRYDWDAARKTAERSAPYMGMLGCQCDALLAACPFWE